MPPQAVRRWLRPPAVRGLNFTFQGHYIYMVRRALKVECLLTLAIWSYGHEAEEYIFLNLPFPSNPKENSSIRCILSTPGAKSATTYYRLYYSGYRLHPNTFHNTINKNVNHSNDTIDNLNQSSFHKPARQCQGHLRTESFPALLTFCTAA